VFIDRPVRNYRDVVAGDAALAKRFNGLLRERGLLKSDSKFYISLAHNEADLARAIGAIEESAAIMGTAA